MSVTEADRTASIEVYDVLHRPPLSDLQAVVELAARICDVPLATVNLITDSEQHQVATFGFDAAICRREDSMCAVVLDADTPVVVPDASVDPRFSANPFVTGELGDVRFYASHRLVSRGGLTVGTLCVFDVVARDLDPTQRRALATLADGVVDILELRARENQLAESNERLAVFARRVSHDLKTPLSSVMMSMDLLREQIEDGDLDPANASVLLDRAVRGSERMGTLIDDVLHDAAAENRRRAEPVDLAVLVSAVLDDLTARMQGATVEVDPLPVVPGHAFQLRAVLQNLLENAAKYRSPDRPLAVRVGAERLESGDGRLLGWRVVVADNGVGIPTEDRDRVLHAGERGTNHDVAGAGVGLDTSRRAVESHLGRLGIDETRGGGTTAWFELPA